jgi:hypothetical protein
VCAANCCPTHTDTWHTYRDTKRDEYDDCDSDDHPDQHRNSYVDTYSDPDPNRYGHLPAAAHTQPAAVRPAVHRADEYADADLNAHGDADPDRDQHGNQYGDCQPDRDPHVPSLRDRDAHARCDRDAHVSVPHDHRGDGLPGGRLPRRARHAHGLQPDH